MSIMSAIMVALIIVLLCVVIALVYFVKEYERYIYNNYTEVEPIKWDYTRETGWVDADVEEIDNGES